MIISLALYLCGHSHEHWFSSFGEKGKQVNVGCFVQDNSDVYAGFASLLRISHPAEHYIWFPVYSHPTVVCLHILIVLHHSFYTHPYSYLNSSFRTVLCILSYAYYILPKTDSSQKAFPKMIFRTFLFSTMAFGETVEFLKPAWILASL